MAAIVLPSLTPAHNGVLVVEAQPQRKGRPAAAGRELMRLVWIISAVFG
tara:strand:+ start:830 stop:976 length:147 start_codon:yes stop_codon:yes gene_type:complete